MKFLADCMLGKLAKWLRLIGLDTVYLNHADDEELIRIALREDRVLLTRDNILARRRILRGQSLFIDSPNTGKQFSQVISKFGIKVDCDSLFTRCIICNKPILTIPKQEVKGKVPSYVYATQDVFGYCPNCGRIYWKGTHIKHVMKELNCLWLGWQ